VLGLCFGTLVVESRFPPAKEYGALCFASAGAGDLERLGTLLVASRLPPANEYGALCFASAGAGDLDRLGMLLVEDVGAPPA